MSIAEVNILFALIFIEEEKEDTSVRKLAYLFVELYCISRVQKKRRKKEKRQR